MFLQKKTKLSFGDQSAEYLLFYFNFILTKAADYFVM